MAHTDPHAALLEHVANPSFYGAQLNSVHILKQRAIQAAALRRDLQNNRGATSLCL